MTDDFDRTLHDAFQSRHVPHDIQPSLVDVRWRARRRHNRRKAAVVGCAAITGAGAVAVLAARHPGDDGRGAGSGASAGATAAGAGDLPATTVACHQFPTSTIAFPPTTAPVNTLPPTTVLEFEATTTTTLPPFADPRGFQVPCESGTGAQTEWHCTDWITTDELGREVYLSCEPSLTGVAATLPPAVESTYSTIEFPEFTTTTSILPVDDFASTTTSLG